METLNRNIALAIGRSLAVGPPRSQLQRALAIAQQAKDTITIGLMLSSWLLFYGIAFGIAIPGLVLYAMRWRLVARTGRTSYFLWAFSLLHELVWAFLFYADHPLHDETGGHYEIGYVVGAMLCALALLDHAGREAKAPRNYDSNTE